MDKDVEMQDRSQGDVVMEEGPKYIDESEEVDKVDNRKYIPKIVDMDSFYSLNQWVLAEPREYNVKYLNTKPTRVEAIKEMAIDFWTETGKYMTEEELIEIAEKKNDMLTLRLIREYKIEPTRLQTPGRMMIKTYEGDQAIDLHPSTMELMRPFKGWPMMNALLKLTIPRERVLDEEEIKNLSHEDLVAYARACEYWRVIWFVQKFFHFHTKIRNTTLPGEKEDQTFWRCPPLACLITANVLEFDWHLFQRRQYYLTGRLFDVIVTDPPWTLATEKSTRGVALNYDQITDAVLLGAVPFEKLLDRNGVIFMWIINAKMRWALQFMKERGLTVVSLQTWFKMSTNDLQARGHGYYLQHAKEDCLVAVKGDALNDLKFQWDAVFQGVMAHKRCQSQKPTLFYDMVEQFVPDGFYLEVFGRRNNLRNGWVTIGNQL